MAGSVNKVILVGNLGQNPEVKFLPSGQAVCQFSIATSETYRDRNEQQQERTEWHRIVVWGKVGENCGKFLTKGQKVYLEGRLQTRSWDDKEGKKQYMTEVVANQVLFLSGPRGGAEEGARGAMPEGDGGFGGSGESRSGGYGGGESRSGGYGGGRAPSSSRSGGGGRPEPAMPPQNMGDFGGGMGGDDDIPF